MRILILTDAFLPFVNSASVQLHDLTTEFLKLGHAVDVVTPKHPMVWDQKTSNLDCLNVIRFKSLNTKSANLLVRFVAELFMPVMALRHFRKIFLEANYDLIIWYSPSIFWGPLVRLLQARHKCPTYLILRDIFPEWASELGIIKNKAVYSFLKLFANYQYQIADYIGIQSEGNRTYLKGDPRLQSKIKVLNNWQSEKTTKISRITQTIRAIDATHKFVYAGKLGIAQGLEIFFELAKQLSHSSDHAFIFIGSGSLQVQLKKYQTKQDLKNLHIFDPVPEDEIDSIIELCDYGIVALSPKHESHNIPGKFVTYVRCSLPVIAVINENNDLVRIIREYNVGVVSCSDNIDDLTAAVLAITKYSKEGTPFATNCRKLFDDRFKTSAAAKQILSCNES